MMELPKHWQPFFNEQRINLLEIREIGELAFENQDNKDFFTMVYEFYCNDGRIDLALFKKKFPGKEIYWETLAAIAESTNSKELLTYALGNKGGHVAMCTALENLKNEGKLEGKEEGREEGIEAIILDNLEEKIPNERILQKLQKRFGLSEEKAKEYFEKYSKKAVI